MDRRGGRDVLVVQSSGAACAEGIAALVEGRAGIVLAVDETDLLPDALAAADAGFAVLSQRVVAEAASLPPLTGTERTLLRLVAAGSTNRDVALRLGCSVATVKREIARLIGVLGAEDRAGLIDLAIAMGFGSETT